MRRKEFAGAGGEEFFVEHEPGRHPVLSVVVPLYDEEPIVPVLVERLVRVLDELAVDAEVILVDDGSSDGTPRGDRAGPRGRPAVRRPGALAQLRPSARRSPPAWRTRGARRSS